MLKALVGGRAPNEWHTNFFVHQMLNENKTRFLDKSDKPNDGGVMAHSHGLEQRGLQT